MDDAIGGMGVSILALLLLLVRFQSHSPFEEPPAAPLDQVVLEEVVGRGRKDQ